MRSALEEQISLPGTLRNRGSLSKLAALEGEYLVYPGTALTTLQRKETGIILI